MKTTRSPSRAKPPDRPVAINQIIGREITARRKAVGLSRNDFAALVGVTQRTMKQVEAGAVRLEPSVFLRAAQILGLRPSDIFRNVASVFTADLAAIQGAAPGRAQADRAALRAQLERIMDKCDDIIRIIDLIEADEAP